MAHEVKNKKSVLQQLEAKRVATREEIARFGLNYYASFAITVMLEHFATRRVKSGCDSEWTEKLEQAIIDISQPDARPAVVDLLDDVYNTCAAIAALSKGEDSIED